METLKDLNKLKFAEGIEGIAFGEGYFYASKGFGNMTSYYSIEEAKKELKGCDIEITDLELNDCGEIAYLYGYFEE